MGDSQNGTDLFAFMNALADRFDKLEKGNKRQSKKINSELRRLKQGDAPKDAKASKNDKAAAAGDRPSKAEKRARREAEAKALEDAIAERLKSVSPEAREKFEKETSGRSAADRAIAAMKLHGESQASPKAADPAPATPSQTMARGPGAAHVQSVAHPKSMAEWYKLPKEAREALVLDDSFDLDGLAGERARMS